MELLTKISKSKEKLIYQLEPGEFEKGEWLKNIPNGRRVKIEYTSNNNILIVDDTPRLYVKKSEMEGNKNVR